MDGSCQEKPSSVASHLCVTSHHISAVSSSIDDNLKKFWEVEEPSGSVASWSLEEQEVVEHFKQHHYQNSEGRFVVPLPKHTNVKPLNMKVHVPGAVTQKKKPT